MNLKKGERQRHMDKQNTELKTIVSISRADKKFLAAALFLQTSILCLAISMSGTFHNNSLDNSIKHHLKIKAALNKLEGDVELHRQKERYKAQGLSTEDVK